MSPGGQFRMSLDRSGRGAGVGQGLGELVAPSLVFGLEGSELVDGVGPPLRPRPAVLRPLEGPDGLAARQTARG